MGERQLPRSAYVPIQDIGTVACERRFLNDMEWISEIQDHYRTLGCYTVPNTDTDTHRLFFRIRKSPVLHGLAREITKSTNRVIPGYLPKGLRNTVDGTRKSVINHEETHLIQQLRLDAPRTLYQARECIGTYQSEHAMDIDTDTNIGYIDNLGLMSAELLALMEAQAIVAGSRSKNGDINRMGFANIARVIAYAAQSPVFRQENDVLENAFNVYSPEGEYDPDSFMCPFEYCVIASRNPDIFLDVYTGKITRDEFINQVLGGYALMVICPELFVQTLHDPSFQVQLDQRLMDVTNDTKEQLRKVASL